MARTVGLILAGGKGSRLWPLTLRKPTRDDAEAIRQRFQAELRGFKRFNRNAVAKPAVPICNRPMIEHSIEQLRSAGVEEIYVNVYTYADSIKKVLRNGGKFGVRVHYEWARKIGSGIGNVLLESLRFLAERRGSQSPDDTLLVLSGDIISDFNLPDLLAAHLKTEALASIVLHPAQIDKLSKFSSIAVEDENSEFSRIISYQHKVPVKQALGRFRNSSIYAFRLGIRSQLAPLLGETNLDISRDIFPFLAQRGVSFYGYPARGYWADVGTFGSYFQVHRDALEGRISFGSPGISSTEEGVKIFPGASFIEPFLMDRDCQVEPGVAVGPFAVIGKHWHLRRASRVINSVLWGNHTDRRPFILGESVRLDKCLVGSGDIFENQSGAVLVNNGEEIAKHELQAKDLDQYEV